MDCLQVAESILGFFLPFWMLYDLLWRKSNCSFSRSKQRPLSRHASLYSFLTTPATTLIESLRPLPSSSCPYQLSELRNDLQARGCRRSVTIPPKICLRLDETDEQIGLHPPGLNQAVYREDCTQCFDSIVSLK